MGHIDDAHDTKGDGEAHRRQQQHGSQRQAVPEILQSCPLGLADFNGLCCGKGSRFQVAFRCCGECRKKGRCLAITALLQKLNGRHLVSFGPVAFQGCGGNGGGHECGNAGICFGGQRLLKCRQGRGVAGFQHRGGGLAPHFGVGTEQRQAAECVLNGAAHRVVDLDLFKFGFWRFAGAAQSLAGPSRAARHPWPR